MANLICNAATNIHNEQVSLSGSGDSIPATSALYVAIGTAPGGPYTFQLIPSFPGVQGDGSIGQQTGDMIACGLTPGTQYYYRTEERDFATGGTVIDAGPECTFTATNAADDYFAPADIFMDCGFLGTRNDISTGAQFQQLPLDASCNDGFYEMRIEYSTVSNVGPWTLAPNVYSGTILVSNPAPVGLASNPFDLAFDYDANTAYFVKMTLIRNGVDYSSVVQSTCTTDDYNSPWNCGIGAISIDATTAALQWSTASNPGQTINIFDGNGDIPANHDTITWHYGTTPGGPYPNTIGPEPFPGSGIATGLTTGTTYYYFYEISETFQTGGVYATSPECSWTQTNDLTTDAPINVDADSGDVGGTADWVPPTNNLCVVWGTTPGGPYPNTACCEAGDNSFNQQVGPCTAGPVPPGTTVYYRTEVQDGGTNALIEAGPEDSFTVAAAVPAVDCQPATLITTNSATLNGTGDNIPANQFIRLSFSTINGGPYGDVGPNVAGTNVVGQPINRPIAGLVGGTTYYYVVEHLDTDGTTVLTTSSQCQFTTLAPASVAPECNPATFIQFTQADLQGTVDNLGVTDYAVIEYGTTPGGPYPTKSGSTPGNNTVDQLIPPVPYSAGPLIPGTYYYRVGVYSDPGATTFIEASDECSFTIPASTVDCGTATNPTMFSIDVTGTAHNVLPNWIILMEYGTTPGGPYPDAALIDNGDGSANQPFSETIGALDPGTTYYYRYTVYDEIANEVFASPECGSFQTDPEPVIIDPCEAATNVTPFSATLNGTATNVPAGFTRRFRYGTAPGVYTNTVPAGVFSGASPEAYSANIAGLIPGTQYYYTSEVLDPGLNVVAESPVECTFVTQTLEEGGIVSWCGAFYDSGQCIFVPTNNGGYFYCAGAEAIDE